MNGKSNSRTVGWKAKMGMAAALAAAGVFIGVAPAQADTDIEWRGISCNYGYFISLHSNGANTVVHTQRHVGTDQSTNKSKTWSNPIWGATRTWGYGYQSTTFSEVYSSAFWISASNQYWDCA